MLEARMDRQKFNKMMERSDFMNLRGHGRQGQSAQVGLAGHRLTPPHPAQRPTYLHLHLYLHLPPEGGVDGKEGEQRHAGHGAADHEGDRGGACQLQGLGRISRWSMRAQGWAAAGGPAPTPSPTLTGNNRHLHLHPHSHTGWNSPPHLHVHGQTQSHTWTCI